MACDDERWLSLVTSSLNIETESCVFWSLLYKCLVHMMELFTIVVTRPVLCSIVRQPTPEWVGVSTVGVSEQKQPFRLLSNRPVWEREQPSPKKVTRTIWRKKGDQRGRYKLLLRFLSHFSLGGPLLLFTGLLLSFVFIHFVFFHSFSGFLFPHWTSSNRVSVAMMMQPTAHLSVLTNRGSFLWASNNRHDSNSSEKIIVERNPTTFQSSNVSLVH